MAGGFEIDPANHFADEARGDEDGADQQEHGGKSCHWAVSDNDGHLVI